MNYRFNNPLTIAPKKDASRVIILKRLCLDLRYINKLLPDDKYSILLIRDILETLAGTVIFIILDLKIAYH